VSKMTVKELIKILKKYPADLEVGMSAHDNSEWEIASWIRSVELFDKDEQPLPNYVVGPDRQWYADQPRRAVVLRG